MSFSPCSNYLLGIYTVFNFKNLIKHIRSLLEEQTNDIYRKLNLHKKTLNNEIDKSNNTSIEMENEFYKWKDRIKENNDTNILWINEAHKLIDEYRQKMYVQDLP